ncbi:galactose mutarotase-like domain-containing protein [Russula brevipes]|nr:galactose mutarotase-like domain-containing protein [Russula brevipes]
MKLILLLLVLAIPPFRALPTASMSSPSPVPLEYPPLIPASTSTPPHSPHDPEAPTAANESEPSAFVVPSSSVAVLPSSISMPSSDSAVSSTSSLSPLTQEDMYTVLQRRLDSIIASTTRASHVTSWLQTLRPDGRWPASEIDYTAGCSAQRANWPASMHWSRILTMSAAWHGGLRGAKQWAGSPVLARGISSAMDYWFSRDFTVSACLDQGGTDACPCDTPGFWNTNWFSNVILIPGLVGRSCLLFKSSLSPAQIDSCVSISQRAYDTFYMEKDFLTGANTLDVAKIGIDLSLLTSNAILIADAYRRIHAEVVIHPGVAVDGIKPDGSFSQHGGLLYNGNYGKDYSNDVLELEIAAAGTQYAAGDTSRRAFETLVDGDQWMIYRNVKTNVLHWDFSTLPRFISFPVIDDQATSGLKIDLSDILRLGELWDSSTMVKVYRSLIEPTDDANAGKLIGNRYFYSNDYMVHRGPGYVSTLKMYSTRTKNTECINSQNPFGFHLADGTLYTYLQGDEYEDIAAAWDWNLIPGTTVDYGATKLECTRSSYHGLESFVGGVSTGKTGTAAMRYLNPQTKAFSWQKAWFFLDDHTQYVMIANLSSHTAAPVYSVLDQRRHSGTVFVDGAVFETPSERTFDFTASSLWHGGVGYLLEPGETTLTVSVGERTGKWSAIGTSMQPAETVDLFAAWIEHKNLTRPVSYTIFPGTTFDGFQSKSNSRKIISLQNDNHISAIFDADYGTTSAVFWDNVPGIDGPISISVSGNVVLMVNLKTETLTVSDPSQTLTSVDISIEGIEEKPWASTVKLITESEEPVGNSITQQRFLSFTH